MPLRTFCSATGDKRSASPSIVEEFYDVQFPMPNQMERCSSNVSVLSYSKDICRICHCEGDEDSPLIAPCYCAGSLRYVHQSCLQQWIKSSNTKNCELCKFLFIMNTKVKPFNKWEILDLSWVEKRKILCSVTFHGIAIFCVVWSLFVLIQRTSREVQEGSLEWPFWTKIIVVAIGISGSMVFMYVQCKMYYQLCRRWRAFNRVIYVQNAPEKVITGDPKNTIIHIMQKEQFGALPKSPSFTAVECEKSSFPVSVMTDCVSPASVRSYSPEGTLASGILEWPQLASMESKACDQNEPELENLIPSVFTSKADPSTANKSSRSSLQGPPEEVFGSRCTNVKSPGRGSLEILKNSKSHDDIPDCSDIGTVNLSNN